VRGSDGEWVRVGQTERVGSAAGRDVSFTQPVSINVSEGREFRFGVYDIRNLVNDAAFLHISDDGLVGEATVSAALLSSGEPIDVALQKDGKDTGSSLRIGRPGHTSRFGVSATGEWLCCLQCLSSCC